ncbi:Uncharacterized protein PECH_002223 [Penicillium ucsense]|uniref:Vacuolar sorting protein Vps3844 C-terminal domain-containing protein n=1 Tax=Penicillium ucsense TaxID=2839758 RepID=A0A8J8VYP3_9EURO|nr:Uncharacterized protein PECM_001392 [Penicillium ucsense]KAF7731141.1 Uncharacterized protein PECH_002223 [Penicillium ucsense]
MHLVARLFAVAATSSLGAHALETSIFTFPGATRAEHGSAGFKQQTMTEDVARLVLELRTEASLQSVLGKVDAETVDRLNEYSGAQESLFGGDGSQATPNRNLVVFEGINEALGTSLRKAQPHSIIVPHASSELVEGSIADRLDAGKMKKRCAYYSGDKAKSSDSQSAKECLSQDPVLSQSQELTPEFLNLLASVEVWSSTDNKMSASTVALKGSSDKTVVSKSLQSLFQSMDKLASSKDHEITVLTMSAFNPSADFEKLAKRDHDPSQQSPYATSAQSIIQKSAQTQALSSVLAPICHASNSSCADATNSCSGHGQCYLKSSSGDSKCFACKCKPTVRTRSNGSKQTIYWGGPACQKEDISSPFFMIAGVTILAIVLVTGAVGMLFSMGSEELPSVIGAGITGAKAPA